jgi:hypothetical protein
MQWPGEPKVVNQRRPDTAMARGTKSRKSKKARQCNGQCKNDQRTNNDLQSFTQKTKISSNKYPLKPRGELGCHESLSSSCTTCVPRRVTLVTDTAINHE